jgi:hypothetical protein
MCSFFMPRVIYACPKLSDFGLIEHCNVILNFLTWCLLPSANAVEGVLVGFPLQLWSCFHCSSNSEAGCPLQFAMFCLTCFEFDLRPPYSGGIGDYVSYHCSEYPTYHPCCQSPSLPKRVSACPEGLIGLIISHNQLFFPRQPLV